ncbi:uncharacterized protein LOC144942422 isoform X3 [Lampetra fluviatilis]
MKLGGGGGASAPHTRTQMSAIPPTQSVLVPLGPHKPPPPSSSSIKQLLSVEKLSTGLPPKPGAVRPEEMERESTRVQAIQRMQFHDFPLTTAGLTVLGTPTVTHARILQQLELAAASTATTPAITAITATTATTATNAGITSNSTIVASAPMPQRGSPTEEGEAAASGGGPTSGSPGTVYVVSNAKLSALTPRHTPTHIPTPTTTPSTIILTAHTPTPTTTLTAHTPTPAATLAAHAPTHTPKYTHKPAPATTLTVHPPTPTTTVTSYTPNPTSLHTPTHSKERHPPLPAIISTSQRASAAAQSSAAAIGAHGGDEVGITSHPRFRPASTDVGPE